MIIEAAGFVFLTMEPVKQHKAQNGVTLGDGVCPKHPATAAGYHPHIVPGTLVRTMLCLDPEFVKLYYSKETTGEGEHERPSATALEETHA